MIERHKHWRFTAFNDPLPAEPDHKVHWPVVVDVLGYECEADAEIGARSILTREHFRLHSVWECAACGAHEQAAESLAALVKKA